MDSKSSVDRFTAPAGIDISSREHWVAVDPDHDDKPVRCFSTFSNDLYALADWLKSLDVEVIAIRFDRGGNLIGEGW